MNKTFTLLLVILLLNSFHTILGQTTFHHLTAGVTTLTCPISGTYYFVDPQLTTGSAGGTSCGTSSTLNYLDNIDITETFCSSNGSCITLNFGAFNTAICSSDTLYVYDGPSTASPPLTV